MESIEVLYYEFEAKSKTDQDLTESTTSFFKEKLNHVTEINKNQILIYAVQKRTINIIRYFVKAEIKVTLPLKTETAIHIAIKCNYTDYFDLLFYVYGNVNYKTVNKKFKFSHFQAACMTNNVQRVQNFIDAGVDVNAGKPLLAAIERKNLEVIKFLLKSGANANVFDKRGRTPLHLIFSQLSDGTEYETDLELFRLLIKAKSDVNKTDKNGNSPMFYLLDRDLCIDNKKKALEILLHNGANVMHVNKFGSSIMHYVFCCENRKERDIFELIELFLKHGAHVNATDKWGLTPLHLICSQLSNIKGHGHELTICTIKLLLSNGANINTVDGFGRTPINFLCSQLSKIKDHGDEFAINIIELLLSNGVNINTAVDTSGRTPINSLCSKLCRDSKYETDSELSSDLKLFQVLIKFSDVNRKDKEGNNTVFNLFEKCCGSSLQWIALKTLLQNGANVTHINSAGDTILHHLIKLNYENEKHVIDIYELLLSNGADVNAVDLFGRTPINSLCSKRSKDSNCDSDFKIFQLFIKYKSDVNIEDNEGNSPMFNLFNRSWMSYAQKDALDILIQSGADVTHINNSGDSILHHLIYLDYKNQEYAIDIIELLLSNGANVDAVDKFGKTPVNLLCGKLSSSNKNENDFHLKLLQFLIEYKCDVNRKDEKGNSPIFNLFKGTGINCFQKDALEILIYYGVDIEHVNNNGDFILHRVINSINNNKKLAIDVIKLILSNGADVNVVDRFGRTPINLLCDYLRNGDNCDLYSKIFQLLIEHKSDINKKDTNGNSPIFNLFDKSWISAFQWNALQLFLKNGANVRDNNGAGDSILHQIINSNENEKKRKIKNKKQAKTKKISVDVVIELLLNNGADVNAVDTFGRTPINLLCYQLNRSFNYDPDLKILQLLIEHKSDVNHKDKQGNNPMFNLFNKSDYRGIAPYQWDALKILLNNGANVMQVNDAGHTIAHYTDLRRSISTYVKPYEDNCGIEYCVIESLVEHGMDVNLKFEDGNSLLNVAVSYSNYHAVKLLLGLGADVDTVNFQDGLFEPDNQSLPNLETTQNILSIIELLESKGFLMKNHHHNAVLKFFTAYDLQDFKGRVSDIDYNYLFRLGNIATIDQFTQRSKEQASIAGRDGLYISTYLEILRNLYITKNSNFYMDAEVQNCLEKSVQEMGYQCYTIDREIERIKECIGKAKETMISESISLYDLCSSSPERTFSLLKKCNYKSVVNSEDFGKNFFGIAEIVKAHITKSIIIGYVKSVTLNFLKAFTKGIQPDLCNENLFKYLDIRDILLQ